MLVLEDANQIQEPTLTIDDLIKKVKDNIEKNTFKLTLKLLNEEEREELDEWIWKVYDEYDEKEILPKCPAMTFFKVEYLIGTAIEKMYHHFVSLSNRAENQKISNNDIENELRLFNAMGKIPKDSIDSVEEKYAKFNKDQKESLFINVIELIRKKKNEENDKVILQLMTELKNKILKFYGALKSHQQ